MGVPLHRLQQHKVGLGWVSEAAQLSRRRERALGSPAHAPCYLNSPLAFSLFACTQLSPLPPLYLCAQVPNWSSLGRLKRSKFPHLGGGGHTFGGGAGAEVLAVQ